MMKFGLLGRFCICLVCGLVAFLLTSSAIREEVFFLTFISTLGSAGFLLPKLMVTTNALFVVIKFAL